MRPVHELSSLSSSIRENPSRDSENEQLRIFLERQKEQILADCRAEIQKHEFQADYDLRVSRTWMELSSLNEVRLFVLLQETNNFDEINNFFMHKLLEQNRELRVMTTPQKTRFRSVNLYKEFAYRSEIE